MRTWKYVFIGLIAGAVMMVAMQAVADTVKQYTLVEAGYDVIVEGEAYGNEDLPFMNYEGHTYVPLRAIGELVGAEVHWSQEQREVHIKHATRESEQASEEGTEDGTDDEPIDEDTDNPAFRNIEVSGSGGQYTVTGEARVFEGTMQYAVSDGHNYLIEDFMTLDEGAPAWSAFELELYIDEDDLPSNGTLTLELFEESAKDGSQLHLEFIVLEQFGG